MKRTVSFLALALVLTLGAASTALAGGEKCAHASKAAHKEKAAKMAAHGWLGIETEKDEATGAVRVAKVVPGSPAAEAGFRAGDTLVALNGVAINAENKEALKKAKSSLAVGKQVTYTVARNGAQKSLTATLAPVPEEVLARWMQEEEEAARVASNN
jgi:S1-C subfamily serine protease